MSAITEADVDAWRGYIGRSEVRRQRLDVEMLRRFAAAVGSDLDVERQPPPLGHWAYFLDVAPPEGLGPDGHPRRGGRLLPPVTLQRRMFASAALTFAAPLALGEDAELTLTVADVRHRPGKSGDLVFVEVDRVLTQGGAERLTERQTIVYRAAGGPTPAVEAAVQPPRPGEEIWTPLTTDLFRFSAVTFNSHRIHYDQAYAQGEEGYPDLVVQGPFTALKLCALAARLGGGAPMRAFSFRANAPLLVGQPVSLAPGGGPGEVEAMRCDGAVAMSARAEF